jgi:PAS domain-containing protein
MELLGWGCVSRKEESIIVRQIIARRLRSLYIDIPALRPGTVGAYALAFVTVGVATALRVALNPYVVGAQFITFFPAIVITTLISGFGAGLFSAVLSTTPADFFVLAPRFSFFPETTRDLADLLLFGPLAFLCVMLVTQMRTAIEREQVEANRDRLQLALDAAQLGWWEYDPLNRGVLWWDRRSKEIYDVAEDKTAIEEFTKRLHPDDVEMVWAGIEKALDPTNPKHHRRFREKTPFMELLEGTGLSPRRCAHAGRRRSARPRSLTLASIPIFSSIITRAYRSQVCGFARRVVPFALKLIHVRVNTIYVQEVFMKVLNFVLPAYLAFSGPFAATTEARQAFTEPAQDEETSSPNALDIQDRLRDRERDQTHDDVRARLAQLYQLAPSNDNFWVAQPENASRINDGQSQIVCSVDLPPFFDDA